MRVVQFVGPAAGGIGVHVDSLAADLEAAGADVVRVTAASTARAFGWAGAVIAWPRAGRPADLWRLRAALRQADVVHAHGLRAGALAAALAPRTIVSLHNEPPAGAAAQAGAMMRLVAHRAALVTGASSDLVAWAARFGAPSELAMVPSPLVPELLDTPADPAVRRAAWHALASREGLDSARPLVLSVARIAPQKRIPDLVGVARALGRQAEVVLIGAADAQLAAELGSLAPVHYLGPRADLAAWYRAAAVLTVTSTWEARALVAQEAMAAGVPVVATNVGGLPDLVSDAQTGYLRPVGDVAALAAATRQILDNPDLAQRLGTRARQVAATWPDRATTAADWLARYRRAIG